MYDSTKDMLYEVVYKDGNVQEGKIVDEVTESKLAYAANCPITITNNNAIDLRWRAQFCYPSLHLQILIQFNTLL